MAYTGKKFTNRLIAGVLVTLVLVALLLGGIFAIGLGGTPGNDDLLDLNITAEEGIENEDVPHIMDGVVPDYDDAPVQADESIIINQ